MIVTVKREVPMGHRLLGYDGRCAYLHGHNYTIEASVTGKPDGLGLVVDFSVLKKQLDAYLDKFDHSLILHEDDPVAEILRMERMVLLTVNPSAENLASLVFNHLVDLGYSPATVRIQETHNGWAVANAVDRGVRIKAVQ